MTLFPGGNRWSGVSYPSLTSLIQRLDVKRASGCVGTSESPLCDSEKIARCDSTGWDGWGSRRGYSLLPSSLPAKIRDLAFSARPTAKV